MAHNDERAAIELDEHQLKKNPLWNHVVLLEKASSGGNAVWKCKYCSLEYRGSYSRVKSHLLRITGGGIKICPRVTKSVLGQLKNVAKAPEGAKLELNRGGCPVHGSATSSLIYEVKI